MTYRDDLGALRQRLDNLQQERNALEGRKRVLEERTARLDEVADELSKAREQEKQRRLPVLDNVRVAAPCPADWDDMIGDERVRFCGQCAKNVYNVINLTKKEAEDIISVAEGQVCMRLYQRKDGTVLTADCPVGVKKRRRRRVFAGALLSAGASLLAYAGVQSTVMGEIEYEVTTGVMGDEDLTVVAGGIEAVPQPPPSVTIAVPHPTCGVGRPPPAPSGAKLDEER